MIELNTIYNEDCLIGMSKLEANSIDLVVTDPPYGIDYKSGHRVHSELETTKGILNDGDENLSFLTQVAAELYRVMKNNTHIYWFARWDKTDEQLPMLEEAGFTIKNNLIWVKNNWSMGDLEGAYAGQYECIIFAQKGRKTLNEVDGVSRHSDIIEYKREGSKYMYHSHQKPIALIEFLIRKSSVEGDLVLDAFIGSGTTAIASHNVNRDYIGYEQHEPHYQTAIKRIENETAQTNIFDFLEVTE